MSAQGAPVRSRQKIPFSTRRSSTRGTPRGLFGSSGWITDHSKSVRSKRAICILPPRRMNQRPADLGIRFMGLCPRVQVEQLAAQKLIAQLGVETLALAV